MSKIGNSDLYKPAPLIQRSGRYYQNWGKRGILKLSRIDIWYIDMDCDRLKARTPKNERLVEKDKKRTSELGFFDEFLEKDGSNFHRYIASPMPHQSPLPVSKISGVNRYASC